MIDPNIVWFHHDEENDWVILKWEVIWLKPFWAAFLSSNCAWKTAFLPKAECISYIIYSELLALLHNIYDDQSNEQRVWNIKFIPDSYANCTECCFEL